MTNFGKCAIFYDPDFMWRHRFVFTLGSPLRGDASPSGGAEGRRDDDATPEVQTDVEFEIVM